MKQTPKIEQIFERFSSALKAELNIPANENLKEHFSAVGSVVSSEMKLLYLFAEDIQRNLYPQTADPQSEGGMLEDLGMLYLGRLPKPATATTLKLRVNGVANSVLRTNLTFKSERSNVVYILDTQYILNGSNDVITVRSIETGIQTIFEVGTELIITEPVQGVQANVFVIEIVNPAVSGETIEQYRKAITDSIQLEPTGGAKTDYRFWGRDAVGVREVYPYLKQNDAGTIEIYVEAENGNVTSQMLSDVENVIELDPNTAKPIYERGRRPMQANLDVKPVVPMLIDIEINGLNIRTLAIEQSIFSSIESYLRNIRPFIDGGQLLRDKNDILNVARLTNVVSDTIDIDNYFLDLKMYVDGAPYDIYTFGLGRIPKLNGVNYG